MIFTFGEIMLRISPINKGQRLIQSDDFRIIPGGSESNVAIALSNLGNSVSFVTKLPNNALGNKIIQYLHSHNVDTSFINLGGKRLGNYWTENGISIRASNVIYDRENSAISEMVYNELDMNKITSNLDWFHVSGITPAISNSACNTLSKILNNLGNQFDISVDLNFRSKLWKWIENRNKEEIHKIMTDLCKNAILISGNESDFQDSLGFEIDSNETDADYKSIAEMAFNKFQNLKYIAVSLRQSISASENVWSGKLFVKEAEINCYEANQYILNDIVDRLGTGDSFTAGIIHGIKHFANDYQKIVDFSVALSALNHTIVDDASHFTENDVNHLLRTKGSGRIIR